ncbi:MAG: hypothetical protein ACRDL3_06590 [Solirubrobacterales bacterium]
MGDFAAKYRPHLEALLEDGEQLRGVCAANHQQSAFKGRLVALATTDRRLVLLPLDRRGDPSGAGESILPDQVASAKAGGAGGGWPSLEAAIADRVAVTLKLRTTDGRKLKLMMMRPGDGVLGKLGGGESQREGVAALAEWFGRLERA